MSKMYKILDFAKLRTVSHIIWDIDGTITDETGKLSQEVGAKIINLGLDGIYHSFITGRDANWIIEKVVRPMQAFYNFPRVRDNLIFFAEVGCVMITVGPTGETEVKVHPVVENHPLKTNQSGIRDKLKQLVYNPEVLSEYHLGDKVVPPFDVVYDANDQGWLIDHSKSAPCCYPYVWSATKIAFATVEKIRTEEGKVQVFDQAPYGEIMTRVIKEAGLVDLMDIEIVSTAINIVPKMDNLKLGKSWAAGRALENIHQSKLGRAFVLDEVIDRTIAVGDGKADLDFTVPTFSPEVDNLLQHRTIQIIFVGGEQDLPVIGSPDAGVRDNIIIQATGQGDLAFDWTKDIIRLQAAKGSRVVSTVLDFLKQWSYFRPF